MVLTDKVRDLATHIENNHQQIQHMTNVLATHVTRSLAVMERHMETVDKIYEEVLLLKEQVTRIRHEMPYDYVGAYIRVQQERGEW